MEMEDFSNQDTHIYDDEIIIRVLNDIFERYFFLLQDFYVSFPVPRAIIGRARILILQ